MVTNTFIYIYSNDSAVMLLPIYQEQVVYVHLPPMKWFDELPAGGVDKGKPPEEATKRALGGNWPFGGIGETMEFPSSQGISAGRYIYAAFCDKKSAPATDSTELIEVWEMLETEFGQRVKQGNWHQWPVIIACYYYQLRKEGI